MKNLSQLMKQAQQMQEKIQETQKKVNEMEVTGNAGGNMVKVNMRGNGSIAKIHIEDSLLNAAEKEILEDLLIAAFNDAKTKMDALTAEEMGKVTSGLSLPKSMSLPF